MEQISMVQECTLEFRIHEEDTHTEIRIIVDNRFRDLWLSKLSELRTNLDEVHGFEKE